MKKFFQRLFKFTAYTLAGIVILLAVAVGLFRLLLPRLPEYQDEIKTWASQAIGMNVEFSGMNARWGLSGPELEFYDAELLRPSNSSRVLAADQVSIGVALTRLLRDRKLVVDRVIVRDTSVEITRLEDGAWWIQGNPVDQLFRTHTSGVGQLGDIEVTVEDIRLLFMQPGYQRPTVFNLPRATVRNDEQRLAIDALVRLPETLGRQVVVTATQLPAEEAEAEQWLVTLDASDVDLSGVSAMLRDDRVVFESGRGNVELSLAAEANALKSAVATLDLADIRIADASLERLAGRVVYRDEDSGWLVAAEDVQLVGAGEAWPTSSYRVDTQFDADGNLVTVDADATYLDLNDLNDLLPVLPQELRGRLAELAPDGVVRDLVATVSDLDADMPTYAVSAELERVGFTAVGPFPGMRGFTGRLRADRSGGRLEIRSEAMSLELPTLLAEPVPVEMAFGTVIWRQGRDKLTILSDNIALRNADVDSQSNVQITIEEDGAPIIDLASTWRVVDIGSAKQLIPEKIIHPKLYEWFQNALVSGEIRNGTTRLYGPIDKFPFDGGEGRFLLEGEVRDSTFRFLRKWPSVEIDEMDVVLDNTRLYTTNNRSVSQGLDVIDASVEIADLRDPVLTIDSGSSGPLATIQDYVRNSPINQVFGGQIDRLKLEGDASFDLELTIPLNRWREFEFTTRIVTDNGLLSVDGFDPPVSDLAGVVTIEKELVSSEGLTGTFLGQPVELELLNAPADDARFQVIARARGTASSDALVDELGLPLAGLLDGSTPFSADILFPRAKLDVPAPLTIRITSDLDGLGLALPAPLDKAAQDSAPVSGEIWFPAGGTRIESRGAATTADLAWQIAFAQGDAGWDFDRGAVALGASDIEPPETRGLHIAGEASDFRLEDWVRLARAGTAEFGVLDRVRSVDVSFESLRLLGQRLEDHTVQIDRSARDWLVQLEGADVTGSVFVPYEFTADRPIVLEMERLVLPGGDDAEDRQAGSVDPATLPPISITADEFAIGQRFFGAVEATFDQTGQGLLADSILATDPTFEIVGNGGWITDDADPMGSKSSIVATLRSTDIEKTMDRLDYEPGIVGDDMTILLNLQWSGGPRLDFLDTLNGEVQVRFGPGNLDEIEPGAGRMFGLMSVVALPRRLSLDFSDVFGKGFGFDKIEGAFQIIDGDAYTCNLSLEGPAADIGIIGRTGLVDRDYEQTAIVAANFGNTLPVVGAVVAGPQVAAALLIFSQIFKKPLQEMGQVYYSIDGSWDTPELDNADAAAFAEAGRRAGCIADPE